jgi:hypothetical protein
MSSDLAILIWGWLLESYVKQSSKQVFIYIRNFISSSIYYILHFTLFVNKNQKLPLDEHTFAGIKSPNLTIHISGNFLLSTNCKVRPGYLDSYSTCSHNFDNQSGGKEIISSQGYTLSWVSGYF